MSDKFILLNFRDGVRTITLNRPERKNAMCHTMYKTIKTVLNEDAMNDKIAVTIITGIGEYFSSGNDVKSAMESASDADLDDRLEIVKDMVTAFINYPKLLIAVINGPAIGIGATMSVLCDILYASEKAVFDTPFVKMGLCIEGASSFTLPFTLGRSKASEVLYLNHKLTAQEAYDFNLISKVIPHAELDGFITSLFKYGQLNVNSIKINKKLVMANFRNTLCECNVREFEQLKECVKSDEFANAVINFMSRGRKNKL